jgi:hypothetical protein
VKDVRDVWGSEGKEKETHSDIPLSGVGGTFLVVKSHSVEMGQEATVSMKSLTLDETGIRALSGNVEAGLLSKRRRYLPHSYSMGGNSR